MPAPLSQYWDSEVGNGWRLRSQVDLRRDGILGSDVTVTNTNAVWGFTGAMQVVIYDGTPEQEILHTSDLYKFGLNATAGGMIRQERQEHWEERVPQSVVDQADQIQIIHMLYPTNRALIPIIQELGKQIAQYYNLPPQVGKTGADIINDLILDAVRRGATVNKSPIRPPPRPLPQGGYGPISSGDIQRPNQDPRTSGGRVTR